jgi:serine phosphatase RsbU (regulator of sigma subunit)
VVEPNIPLGFDGKYRFTEQRARLDQGDTLVLYTDGITEARNEQRTMLGMKRWSAIVERGQWNVDSLLNDVQAFMGEAEQADDVTLMTIHLTKNA